jgi:hypothetical protein
MMQSELTQDEDAGSDSDSDEDTESDEKSHEHGSLEDEEERGVNDTEVEEMTAELGALVELGRPYFSRQLTHALPPVSPYR